MALLGAGLAPVFAVLWLGLALNSNSTSFALALAKIIFAMVAVGSGILGTRWLTAGGVLLSLQTLVALAWVLLRLEVYPAHGLMRTVFLLIVPLAVSGVLLIFAGGLRAGTWPPARFGSTR
jgi:hypothetical protein